MNTMDFRKQLEMMGKAPGMWGVTRGELYAITHVFLRVVGVDHMKIVLTLGKIGKTKGLPDNVADVTMLATPIQIPDDPWALKLSKAALKLLPEGSGVYEIKQVR